jgi:hypothetical protein
VSDELTPRLSGEQVQALKFAAHRQLARWANKPKLSPRQHRQRTALTSAVAFSRTRNSPTGASYGFPTRRATSMAEGWRKIERGLFESPDRQWRIANRGG